MPVQLIAKVKFPYDGKTLLPGDTFLASQNDSVLLIGMGSATRAPQPQPVPPEIPPEHDEIELPSRMLSQRDLTAHDDADQGSGRSKRGSSKRGYKRRDLVAEGDE